MHWRGVWELISRFSFSWIDGGKSGYGSVNGGAAGLTVHVCNDTSFLSLWKTGGSGKSLRWWVCIIHMRGVSEVFIIFTKKYYRVLNSKIPVVAGILLRSLAFAEMTR